MRTSLIYSLNLLLLRCVYRSIFMFFYYYYCMYAKKVVSLHSKYNAKPIGS